MDADDEQEVAQGRGYCCFAEEGEAVARYDGSTRRMLQRASKMRGSVASFWSDRSHNRDWNSS